MNVWGLIDPGYARLHQETYLIDLRAIQVVDCGNCHCQVATNVLYEDDLANLYRLCDPGGPFQTQKLPGLTGEWVIYGTPQA